MSYLNVSGNEEGAIAHSRVFPRARKKVSEFIAEMPEDGYSVISKDVLISESGHILQRSYHG